MSRAKGKRFLIWTAALLGIVIVGLAALPIWFPWILRPIANHYGLSYGSYQRVSYTRFALEEATFTNRSIQVRAQRVELLLPTAWLFRLASHSTGQTFATGANWEVTIQPKQTPEKQRQRSVHTTVRQIQNAVGRVQQWIPVASLTNGVIIVQGDRVAVPKVAWRRTNVGAVLGLPKITNSLVLRATASLSGRWGISIDVPPVKASVDVVASSSNVLVKGTATAGTNRITLAAEFGPDGVLPRTANIEAPAFALQREMLRLEPLAGLSGSARARWNDPVFELDVAGSSGARDAEQLRSLQFVLQAHGTTNQAEISRLDITGPGVTAKLSRPLTVPFHGQQPPAVLSVEADLSRQPWTNLAGTVRGQITFVPTTNRFPRTEFSVSGTSISGHGVRAKSLSATGLIVWPHVELREATAEFPESGRATLVGHADLQQKTIGHLELKATGGAFGQWMPTNAGVRLSSARVIAQGPFTNLTYVVEAAGQTATNRWMNAMDVELKARGFGRTIREASVTAKAKDSTALIRFSGIVGGATNQVRVEELRFNRGPTEFLRLNEPATIRIEQAKDAASFRLQTTPFKLSGSNTVLSVSTDLAWPTRGVVACEIRKLRLQDFAAFLSSNLHTLNIDAADLGVRWENGPVLGFARLDGNYTAGEQFHASCEIAALESGVRITNLLVWSETAPVIYARGTLPLRVQPAGPEQIAAVPEREIDILIGTDRDPAFWERLGKLIGFKLSDPEIEGRISGQWNAPKGEIKATIAKIEMARTNATLPPITDIRLLAELDRRLIRIPELEGRIESQPVRFSGQLPLREKAKLKEMPDWTKAQGRLSIESAVLAPFARYYPKLLAPFGEIDAEIILDAGEMRGHVTITNATTQPLGNFGALREISVRLDFDGRIIRLQEGRARLAGEPVVASGFINLQSNTWGGLPLFQINLVATNVALIRQPEVVIRSDLDIALINSSTNAPVVSGTAVLRDSFYLSDLESLVPGSVAQPEHRPPYFSIETQPLADWQLNLNVTGSEFMKIRTPFLRGTVSAAFRLQGTLREPIAVGEARMNSGAVEFPFGTLTVKQARAWLTLEQPFLPQIYMTASAKRFGYDVTLEVTGAANKPVVQFSSVPSLTSEKIFLMLTAGELPRDEITFSPQQKAQRFAVFVGLKILNSLGFGGTSERLTIRSGEDISESGAQTYDIEYKLTDRWAVVGQYDRFNAFNVSFKRRIFSR
jgi:translocation and assembly module TamB